MAPQGETRPFLLCDGQSKYLPPGENNTENLYLTFLPFTYCKMKEGAYSTGKGSYSRLQHMHYKINSLTPFGECTYGRMCRSATWTSCYRLWAAYNFLDLVDVIFDSGVL